MQVVLRLTLSMAYFSHKQRHGACQSELLWTEVWLDNQEFSANATFILFLPRKILSLRYAPSHCVQCLGHAFE